MRLIHLTTVAALLLGGCASTGITATGGPDPYKAQLKCDGPDFNEVDARGKPVNDEEGLAKQGEAFIHARGYPSAHMTRYWNGCLQTWVRVDGKEQMKLFDPWSYEEITIN